MKEHITNPCGMDLWFVKIEEMKCNGMNCYVNYYFK